jgi:acetyltransferase-like isoleucine patch superfamily enzyme
LIEIHEINGGKVVIDPSAKVKGDLRANGANIFVGAGTTFNRTCVLRAAEGADISIGNECLLSSVEIYSSDLHSIMSLDTDERMNPALPVTIHDRVWIGAKTLILPGVTIGSDSVIGAGSVVTQDIPPNCVAAGSPARVVRTNSYWLRERL